jgi:flagella basal body P-ring formation protein FlgA
LAQAGAAIGSVPGNAGGNSCRPGGADVWHESCSSHHGNLTDDGKMTAPAHPLRHTLLTLLLLTPLLSAQAGAPGHPHGDILAVVEAAALGAALDEGYDQVEVRVRPLDARLRPALCAEPLTTVRPHAGRALGPVSYGVRCSGPVPWTLYLRADVSAVLALPVLAQPLPRGALIGRGDLQLQERRITTPSQGLITSIDEALGKELQRPLPAGSTLRFGHVALPELVTRGQTVTLVAGANGLRVQMQGKALASGAAGDRLLVSNLRSGRRVEGIVLPDGNVRIP